MPGQPAPVEVEVRIFNDPIRGPQDFKLVSGIVSGDELNFRNNGHPGFIVTFKIVNEVAGVEFRFLPVLADALWVRPLVDPADGCPGQQCSWTQFQAQAVSGDGQRLIVRNRNEFTQKFGFALKVTTNAAGAAVQTIDPIGNNQNGPQ